MGAVKKAVAYFRNDMRLSSKLLLSHMTLVLTCVLTILVFFGSSVYNLLIDTTINTKQQTASATAASVGAYLDPLTDQTGVISAAYSRLVNSHSLAGTDQAPDFSPEQLALVLQQAAEACPGVQYRVYLIEDRQWIINDPALAPWVQGMDSIYGTYWYGILSSTGARELFCPSLYLSPREIESCGELAYVRQIDGILQQEIDGYVVAYFPQEPVLEVLSQNLGVSRGASYIINSRDALVCDSNSELVGAYYINNDEVERIVAGGGSATCLGNSIIVCSYPVDRTDWQVVSILPQADALQEADRAVWQLVTLYAVIALLGILLAVFLARTISRRIASVVEKMRQTPEARPRKIEELPPSKDEVGQLVTSYNSMIDSLNELLDRQAEAAKTLRLSEFKALQAQINPHFLYNSLDMINWLAVAGKQDKVCEAVQALGRFYKLALSKKDTFGTVAKETEHASLYVKLQNMRFQERIRFVVDIDERISGCIMPKLVFQPLVENAILHGIMERPDKTGEVLLAGWRDGDDIVFLIHDDGMGMSPDKLEHIMQPDSTANDSHTHIGVYNTHERLRLYYGPQYGLQFKSTLGQGTEVQIRIPFSVREDPV